MSGRQQLNGRYLMTGSFKSFSIILELYNYDVLWHAAGYSCDGCNAIFLQLTNKMWQKLVFLGLCAHQGSQVLSVLNGKAKKCLL